jgi:zinc finger protein
MTLKAESARDLTRDVLKSDTAMVMIPELELELQHGTLGIKFPFKFVLNNVVQVVNTLL